jgi:hypothetical protein
MTYVCRRRTSAVVTAAPTIIAELFFMTCSDAVRHRSEKLTLIIDANRFVGREQSEICRKKTIDKCNVRLPVTCMRGSAALCVRGSTP